MSTFIQLFFVPSTMELIQVNLGYSAKNIPNHTKQTYLKHMIQKLEDFIKRLRWKAFFLDFKTEDADSQQKNKEETFGFRSERTPPRHECLSAFEEDLYKMVKNIKFRKVGNSFQTKLSKDLNDIRKSPHILVPADKSSNMYKLRVEDYQKLLRDNITTTYKKADKSTIHKINAQAKVISQSFKLDDRIECFPKRNAFITLKDHKDNFYNHPRCRLINPAKSEIGIISKFYLDKINTFLRNLTKFNQWRNSAAVISWFEALPDKNLCTFLKFDIVDFYPSISESLLNKALEFARTHMPIDEKTINVILHSRKSLLFSDEDVWVKKSGSNFDVTMGSFDGAEVCELVGLFLLNNLADILGAESVGLYRDDGLAILRNMSGPSTDRFKKKVIQAFKKLDLKITSETNLVQTDFLDITFNLNSGKYWPYRKPNNETLYINTKSNHPPNIIKHLPSMIGKRISQISCNQEEFHKAASFYNEALHKCGYTDNIDFHQQNRKLVKKPTRKRNIVWFNPPFNAQASTNIGKEFFKLLKKHFPPQHRLYKICNKNCIKLSYSCLPNAASIIAAHNKRLLNGTPEPSNPKSCNCRTKTSCPMLGRCRESSLIYKASAKTNGREMNYYGLCETEFKSRYYNHAQSFKHRQKSSSTELSKFVWACRDSGVEPTLNWSIIQHAPAYQSGNRVCSLCLTEKYTILSANESTLLNKRSELMNKCRHKNKFKLKNFKSDFT